VKNLRTKENVKKGNPGKIIPATKKNIYIFCFSTQISSSRVEKKKKGKVEL
jgi:hypothetical protein